MEKVGGSLKKLMGFGDKKKTGDDTPSSANTPGTKRSSFFKKKKEEPEEEEIPDEEDDYNYGDASPENEPPALIHHPSLFKKEANEK